MNQTSDIVIFDSTADLVAAMRGQNTTRGWDVLCSYDLQKLNTVLKDRYKQRKLVSKISNASTWEWALDFGGLQITSYDFELDSPDLSFEAVGKAILTMPISKTEKTIHAYEMEEAGPVEPESKCKTATWYSKHGDAYQAISNQLQPSEGDVAQYEGQWYRIHLIKPPRTVPIEDHKYSLVGLVPIAAVTGNKQIHNEGDVVVFKEADSDDQAHIVLHFGLTNGNPSSFKIVPELNPNNFNEEASLLRSIETYFATKVSEIEYALTAVAPISSPDDITSLTPKSFVFTTIKTGHTDGVLCTYIKTSENGGSGPTLPEFLLENKPCSPIPAGNTASIIFSRYCIQNVLIRDELEKTLKDCKVTFGDPPSGIEASVSSSDVNIPIQIPMTLTHKDTYHTPISPGRDIPIHYWYVYHYVQVTKDILSSQDYPISLTFDGDAVSVAWNTKPASFNYQTGQTSSPTNNSSDVSWSTVGGHKITIHVTSNANDPSKLVTDDSCNITISPPLAFDQSTYGASVTPVPHADCWERFWHSDVMVGIHSALHNALSQLTPKLSLTMPGINYFTTTNILFPGAHVFQADTAAGLQIPCDMLIVGNIGKSS